MADAGVPCSKMSADQLVPDIKFTVQLEYFLGYPKSMIYAIVILCETIEESDKRFHDAKRSHDCVMIRRLRTKFRVAVDDRSWGPAI